MWDECAFEWNIARRSWVNATHARILLLINDTYAVTVAGVQYVNGIFIALQEHVVHI